MTAVGIALLTLVLLLLIALTLASDIPSKVQLTQLIYGYEYITLRRGEVPPGTAISSLQGL